MKNCAGCKHVEWVRTAAGKLHPSGDGLCGYPYKLPPLPAAKHWLGSRAPTPLGGAVNRRKELNDHCVYWSKA